MKQRKMIAPEVRAEIMAYAAEHSVKEAAAKFGVDMTSIYNWRSKQSKPAAKKPRPIEVHTIPTAPEVYAPAPRSKVVIVCDTGSLNDVLRSLNQ